MVKLLDDNRMAEPCYDELSKPLERTTSRLNPGVNSGL